MISKHVPYEAAHDNYGALARYIADAGHEAEKCLASWCAGCEADDDNDLAICGSPGSASPEYPVACVYFGPAVSGAGLIDTAGFF